MPNAGKYSIHGAFGCGIFPFFEEKFWLWAIFTFHHLVGKSIKFRCLGGIATFFLTTSHFTLNFRGFFCHQILARIFPTRWIDCPQTIHLQLQIVFWPTPKTHGISSHWWFGNPRTLRTTVVKPLFFGESQLILRAGFNGKYQPGVFFRHCRWFDSTSGRSLCGGISLGWWWCISDWGCSVTWWQFSEKKTWRKTHEVGLYEL